MPSDPDRMGLPGVSAYDVLIVGAGHGGSQAAIALRQAGFAGSIGLLGEEVDLPYERPPLSKDYLAGTKPAERLLIRPARFWPEKAIDLMLGETAERIDPGGRSLHTVSGRTIGYRKLIWATGGKPRRLTCSGHSLAGIHTVRDRRDVDRLRSELAHGARAVIVGGGYIGLEVAAALTKAGHHVTLLEAQERLLARVAGRTLSNFFAIEHRQRGVDIRLNATVECVEEKAGRVSGVRLGDGTVLSCELVVVGIGIVPGVEPLLIAGAEGVNGVDVDQDCRTSLPDIYAIGDGAAQETMYAAGRRVRIESVQNAHDQAVAAVRSIMDAERVAAAPPWFWSNQYDIKLQTVGLSIGHDETLVRGDPTSRSFSVIYLAQGAVVALDCVNATRDFVQGRRLVAERVVASRATLADPDQPLSTIAASNGEAIHG